MIFTVQVSNNRQLNTHITVHRQVERDQKRKEKKETEKGFILCTQTKVLLQKKVLLNREDLFELSKKHFHLGWGEHSLIKLRVWIINLNINSDAVAFFCIVLHAWWYCFTYNRRRQKSFICESDRLIVRGMWCHGSQTCALSSDEKAPPLPFEPLWKPLVGYCLLSMTFLMLLCLQTQEKIMGTVPPALK